MGEPRFLLLAVSGSAGGAATGVGWRLVGPNNRELGRAPAPAASLEACSGQIARLVADLDHVEGSLTRGAQGLGWGWLLRHADEPLARSGRRFHRERECRYSLEQFLHAVPAAIVRRPSSVAALPVVSARAFAGASADPILNESATA